MLDNLRTLVDEADRRVNKSWVRLKLILADIHGRCNLVPEVSARSYYGAIEEECRRRGFEHVYLSEIWAQNGLVLDEILKSAETPAFNRVWEEFLFKDQFTRQAKKRSVQEDAEKAARTYYAVVMAEREAVARYGSGAVFFTHNDLEYAAVNPPLPTIYIHSIKPGVSEKPWFMGSASGACESPKGGA